MSDTGSAFHTCEQRLQIILSNKLLQGELIGAAANQASRAEFSETSYQGNMRFSRRARLVAGLSAAKC